MKSDAIFKTYLTTETAEINKIFLSRHSPRTLRLMNSYFIDLTGRFLPAAGLAPKNHPSDSPTFSSS